MQRSKTNISLGNWSCTFLHILITHERTFPPGRTWKWCFTLQSNYLPSHAPALWYAVSWLTMHPSMRAVTLTVTCVTHAHLQSHMSRKLCGDGLTWRDDFNLQFKFHNVLILGNCGIVCVSDDFCRLCRLYFQGQHVDRLRTQRFLTNNDIFQIWCK